MNTKPIDPSREQQQRRFQGVQDAVKQLVEAKLPNVQFQSVTANRFVVCRNARPSLRMDVELDEGTKTIRYHYSAAYPTEAEPTKTGVPEPVPPKHPTRNDGILDIKLAAGDEVLLTQRNMPPVKNDEEAAKLLLEPFSLAQSS